LSTGTPTPQPADPQTSEWWSPYDPNWWSSPYEYDVARRHDPLFGNPYYYDPRYADDPMVSANFALWRSGGSGCWKCHVTHLSGWIPLNEELSAYLIDSWHCFDKLQLLIILTALGVHASQTSFAIDDGLVSRQPPQLRAGNLAHDQLEQQYLESVPSNQRVYVDLDKYFTDPWTGKRFKPDAVNHWTGEIVEYKPITYQGNPGLERQAVQQAASYADRLNAIYGDLRAMQGAPGYWWRVIYYVK
jgi:hypothetical protein